jgi:hypothetical protein
MSQLAFQWEPPADLRARLHGAGFPATIPITLHRNRRVMLSFDRATGLRIHAGYATAPDEVIEAIVTWVRPSVRKGVRRAAARVFLGFSVHGDRPPPRRRRPEPPEPGDEARLAALGRVHAELNAKWFGGTLAAIPIELSGRMRRKLGHYEPRANGAALIAISRRHLRRDGFTAVAETLLHEMVHQWQDETGRPVDHRGEFRRKAAAVGIAPRAVARTG